MEVETERVEEPDGMEATKETKPSKTGSTQLSTHRLRHHAHLHESAPVRVLGLKEVDICPHTHNNNPEAISN